MASEFQMLCGKVHLLVFSLFKALNRGLQEWETLSRFKNVIKAPFCALIFISSHNSALCAGPSVCNSGQKCVQGTIKCCGN